MKCPHCGQEHPDNLKECPLTEKELRKACMNTKCSYYGEYIWPLEKDTCPCCGHLLTSTHRGHEFVDLGLSVKWATCNVGASSPEEYGSYFAWAETNPKSYYERENLKYYIEGNWQTAKYSKYVVNSEGGLVDNKTQLDVSDDAASANWGGSWRMPTIDEFQELIDNCHLIWTIRGGKNVYEIKSKSNGNSIILPFAGFYYGDSILKSTYYWSSSLYEKDADDARCLDIYLTPPKLKYERRKCGCSVRPVCP